MRYSAIDSLFIKKHGCWEGEKKLIYLINPAAAEFLRCYKPVIFPTRPGSLSMWAHSYWFQVAKMLSDWTSLGRLWGVHQNWINPWPFLMPVFVELIAVYIFIQPLDVFLLLQREEKRSQLQLLDYISRVTVLMNNRLKEWTSCTVARTCMEQRLMLCLLLEK